MSRTRTPDLWPDIEERTPRSTETDVPSSRRILAIGVALVFAVGGLGVATWALRGTEPPPTANPVVENGRIAFAGFAGTDDATWQIYTINPDGSGLTRLTAVSAREVASDPAWSPDGSQITFAIQGFDEDGTTGRSDIYVMSADGSGLTRLTDGPGSSGHPAWSPDGSRIAFFGWAQAGSEDIYVMNADGTDVTRLTDDRMGDSQPAWSPDGSLIAFQGKDQSGNWNLYLMNTDGSDVKPLTSGAGVEWEPAWSPDGEWIAFTAWPPDTPLLGGISIVRADGTGIQQLTSGQGVPQSAAWSPDGTQIAFQGQLPGSDDVAIHVMNADGTDVHVLSGLPENAVSPAWQPAVEPGSTPSPTPPPDGSISSEGSTLPEGRLLIQVDGQHLEVLEKGADTSSEVGQDLFALDLSPDGSRVLLSTPWESVGPVSALVSLDLSTGERTTIAEFDGWSLPARWSPDGSMVAYRIGERNTLCIWRASSGQSRCLPEIGAVYAFDWSPDASRLVLDQPPSPGSLTVLDVETEQTSVIAHWDDHAVLDAVAVGGLGEPVAIQFQGPQWSTSGAHIAALAMVRTVEGWSGNIVLVFDLSGLVVAQGVTFHEFSEARAWSPTADVYAFASGEPPYRIVDAWLLDAATGDARLLEPSSLGDRIIGSLAWSPSGRWVAVALGHEILIIDITGPDPPKSFRALGSVGLVDWGP